MKEIFFVYELKINKWKSEFFFWGKCLFIYMNFKYFERVQIFPQKGGVYLWNFKGLGLNILNMSNVVVVSAYLWASSKEWSKMGNTHLYKLQKK